MTDPALIATALLTIARAIPGVRDARLGLNSLTLTPAVEVWMTGGSVQQQRAAPTEHLLERHTLEVHFYSSLRPNEDADELLLAGLAAAFVNAIHAPGADTTLGGLVETVRCTRYGLDVIQRNGHAYRAVLVEVEAGEL
jgi:hypothetical protein